MFLTTLTSIIGVASVINEPLHIINRTEWGAKPPKQVESFEGPAPYVIIHHSYIPAACCSPESCRDAMRSMQSFHQDDRGWNDIGYTFGVGGDGQVYQGRGFNVIGAHAPRYNNRSVGICLIGDWTAELPPPKMLQAVKQLIEYGLTEGRISTEYMLLGHRQVRSTECPGQALYNEISTWPHFVAEPEDSSANSIPN